VLSRTGHSSHELSTASPRTSVVATEWTRSASCATHAGSRRPRNVVPARQDHGETGRQVLDFSPLLRRRAGNWVWGLEVTTSDGTTWRLHRAVSLARARPIRRLGLRPRRRSCPRTCAHKRSRAPSPRGFVRDTERAAQNTARWRLATRADRRLGVPATRRLVLPAEPRPPTHYGTPFGTRLASTDRRIRAR
jgi:hypothetical protein